MSSSALLQLSGDYRVPQERGWVFGWMPEKRSTVNTSLGDFNGL